MKYLIALTLILASCRGPRGDQGIQGNVGNQGIAGINGTNGVDGAPGQSIVGPQGQAGADGTIITPVQFCPGVTPSYPSTFPEYGLCINGNLYGVYSTNGGFLALLPPGSYNSNAVGSDCNFNIQANCVVN